MDMPEVIWVYPDGYEGLKVGEDERLTTAVKYVRADKSPTEQVYSEDELYKMVASTFIDEDSYRAGIIRETIGELASKGLLKIGGG